MRSRLLKRIALVFAAAFAPASFALAQNAPLVTPNFRGTHLEEVAQLIGQATERQIEVDPRVRDVMVDLYNDRAMTREELWQVFERLVEEKDLSIVENGEIWTVVPPEPAVVNSVQAQEVPPFFFVPNFSNAPLEEVVHFVEEATNRRIVSDLRFSDVRIYFANDKPMTPNELWESFKQMLQANDLGLIREAEAWKVVTAAEVAPTLTIQPRRIAEPSPERIAP